MSDTIVTIIGYLAPAIAAALTQVIKKLWDKSGYAAIGIVIVLGGLAALIGVGPIPNNSFVDTTVNAGFITGLATLLYSIFKPKA